MAVMFLFLSVNLNAVPTWPVLLLDSSNMLYKLNELQKSRRNASDKSLYFQTTYVFVSVVVVFS